MKFYSIGKFAKLIGRTPQALRDWDKTGRWIYSSAATKQAENLCRTVN